MKKNIITLLIACFILCSCWVFGTPLANKRVKLSRKEKKEVLRTLPPKYKHWLNLIRYISYEDERNIFLSLKNHRDRELFISTFWKQRDPTPGTEANEFKMEMETRFAYVNKYFKRGSSKPGWMTDMGKFWMILGKPTSIERYESKAGLYPAQVWYFHGDASLGLPTYFSVMYYKPHNQTEWKFYSPINDGPGALLISSGSVDETNYQGLFDKIYELAPALAMPSISMIPNERSPTYRPSMRNSLIVARIEKSPQRKVNLSYATHFLNYKGFVDVDSSVNYIPNSKLISVTKYARFGFNFINFSLKPKSISVGYNEEKEQYFFNYELNVTLKKDDKFVHEYKKNFDFYIAPDKVNNLKGNGIVIHDSFPAVPGTYKLTVYAMNSIGKEFTYFEKKVIVPDAVNRPVLATPLIGYKSQIQDDNFFFSYKFNHRKLYVDTEKNLKLHEEPEAFFGVYNLGKELWETGSIQLKLEGANERSNFKRDYTLPLNTYAYNRNLNILYKINEKLNPDYYDLHVILKDKDGNTLATNKVQFSVSPV
ncbi:MAG: GWxTD domain-containing protein, partial [bacterium]|nr:GWxTD domain-containing protein [bacterium]